MYGYEIDFVMRSEPHTARYYLGTFAADTLPRLASRPCLLTMNTKRISNSGEHWAAASVDEDGRGVYFDSYGRPPTVREHLDFMNRNCVQWSYNKSCLQSIGSNVCGQYCVTYLIHEAHGLSLNEYVTSYFSNDTKKNDAVVSLMYQRYAAETTLCHDLSLCCNKQTCFPRK